MSGTTVSEAMEFDEFYVSCNPPLLPKGVDDIIKGVQSVIGNAPTMEILYEPDVPWFKCISTLENRETITTLIQSLLANIFQDEARAIDTNAVNLIDIFRESQVDIKILGEKPRIIPWLTYKSEGQQFYQSFGNYCFPPDMANIKYKKTFRGIEEWEGGTFGKLLLTFRDSAVVDDAPISIEAFEALVSCQVSYSMTENLVYLGTDVSMEVLDQAVQKLKNLVVFAMHKPQRASHLVVLDQDTPCRIALKWMSHVGLSKATYAQTTNSSLDDEYRLLMGAATLRTEILDIQGQWRLDKTVYPNREFAEPRLNKPFTPFEEHTFPTTNLPKLGPGNLNSNAKTEQTSKAVNPPQKASISRQSSASSKASNKIVDKTAADPWIASPELAKHAGRGESISTQAVYMETNNAVTAGSMVDTNQMAKIEPSIPSLNGSVNLACEVTTSHKSYFVDSWMNDVKNAIREEATLEEDLICFDIEEGAESVRPQVPTINTGQDLLICFDDDEPQQCDLECGLNKDPEAIVDFGLMDEVPKDFFRTMDQKASRDTVIKKPGSLCQGMESFTKARTWAAIVGQKAEGVSLPITPMQEITADEAWPKLGNPPPSPKKPKISKSQLLGHNNEQAIQPAPPVFPNIQPLSTSHKESTGSSNRPSEQMKAATTISASSNKDRPTISQGEMLHKVKCQLKLSSRILNMTPGRISLELVFGRIYLKQFSPSQVFSDAGPSFEIEETLEFLNDPGFRQDSVGFSPVITTMGEDANRLSAIRPDAKSQWRLVSTQTWYDFACVFNDVQGPFLVEVDAKTIRYHIQEPRREVFAVYLHCPQRPWDMKVRATRSRALDGMARHRSFAETLVASMTVSNQNPRLTIGTPSAGKLEGRIENVKIRQIAKYRQEGLGQSELNIVMVTAMEEVNTAPTREKKWVSLVGNGSGAIPCRWFEATISSCREDDFFQQNRGLEYGQTTQWNAENVEVEELFDDICKPGLGMIAHLDSIGLTNHNKQKFDPRDAFCDGFVEPQIRKEQQYMFW